MSSSSPLFSSFLNCDDSNFCFPVPSSSVHFLRSPDHFYNTLLQRVESAKRRVVLSALYLGTDALEQRLVHRLAVAAKSVATKRPVEVRILLDFFRATRGATANDGKSSTTMLAPLCIYDNVEVRLFHTPKLRGLLKSVLPERTNEIVGLQHMKFFVFDDTVLITGANLSDQYFVNRRDRYLLIEDCPLLADFFVDLFHLVGDNSFRLLADGRVEFTAGGTLLPIHPETGSFPRIQSQICDAVDKLFAKYKVKVAKQKATDAALATKMPDSADGTTTFVVPFLQMGLFNVNQEVELLSKLFSCCTTTSGQNVDDKLHRLDFTLISAYFNLFDPYADLILHKCSAPFKILFASPQANGFLGAHGLSGHIPAMYELYALDFVRRTVQANKTDRIAFSEWTRPGWTFHGKGIWVEEWHRRRPQNDATAADVADTAWRPGPRVATVVGSSNFGFRSAHRDLEAQLLLVTDNDALRERIAEEKNSLFVHSELLDPSVFLRRDCLIPAWLKYAARMFRHFF
ncbi:hypothetical protein niasHT_033731 [Heterodera trifolii]|uniref:CDP-diacylglycerol--glycerol-3-phosphate 3-phosphatidyltransferase n=1 Tax=Heterodera trifolii TaxID=157864 RepID=A0ABD2I8V6_9BILA